VKQNNYMPRKGAIAVCSVGMIGFITSDTTVRVEYRDRVVGMAWTGQQIGARKEDGAVTMDPSITAGGPWSSRNPRVIGYASTLEQATEMVVEMSQKNINGIYHHA
jgi:hypothetical protein